MASNQSFSMIQGPPPAPPCQAGPSARPVVRDSTPVRRSQSRTAPLATAAAPSNEESVLRNYSRWPPRMRSRGGLDGRLPGAAAERAGGAVTWPQLDAVSITSERGLDETSPQGGRLGPQRPRPGSRCRAVVQERRGGCRPELDLRRARVHDRTEKDGQRDWGHSASFAEGAAPCTQGGLGTHRTAHWFFGDVRTRLDSRRCSIEDDPSCDITAIGRRRAASSLPAFPHP